jgi:hypothetical protein
MMSLDNLQQRTIIKIGKKTKNKGIQCNTFLAEVSTDVFLMMQHEAVYVAGKGSSSIMLWKEIIW